jgi:hypothetical protein
LAGWPLPKKSSCEPQNGSPSLTTGTPLPPIEPKALVLSSGCLTHCVSPDCPAIIAIAFGVEADSTVWWKLSNSVKRSA